MSSSPRLPTLFLALAVYGLLATALPAITIKGSNGKAVQFHTIQSATPKGLTAKMTADGNVIGVTWDKIDLTVLATEHPDIFAAYERTKAGESIELGLTDAAPEGTDAITKYPGWTDAMVGKTEYILQLPAGEPRGILLLSLDDDGDAAGRLVGHQRGSGAWGEFQNKHSFALLSYDAREDGERGDPTVADPRMFAEKGSGAALLSALKTIEGKLKKPGLSDLPIAIFGEGRWGTAFGYSFLSWKPERIIAASFIKGAFYDSAPKETSVKVPAVFIWGEYDNRPEIWKSDNSSVPIHAKAASLKSVWTSAMEFRGTSDPTAAVDYFGKQYLLEMIPLRMPKPVEVPEPAPAPAPEPGASAAPAAPASPEEAPPVVAAPPVIPDIKREAGMIGNLATGETTNIKDPEQAVGEGETFLPNAAIAKLWKELLKGELEPPGKTSL